MLNPMLITVTVDGSFEFEGISTGSVRERTVREATRG
jgi:hypothetical protein